MADGLRVLYVDDEPNLLAIAKIYLERSGEFFVETSDSAQRVMDSSAIPSYDAIISDYQMPEMDGIEFLKEVRKRYGDIPFLLFTGRGREEVVIEAINNGADFYIQKGGDPKAQFAELAHKLHHAITRKRAQGELRTAYDKISATEKELRGQYLELARNEQMIRESEARFREFAELLPQIVFETDRNFRVTFVNNQGYLQTGYAPEDVASGFNSLTVIDPSQHARLKDHTEMIVRGEHYEHGEYTIIRKDGSTFPALVYGDAVCNGGETTGFRGIIINISELKRAEDALRESEEKYRLMVEVNQDIFYSLDHNGTILYVGPQVTDQLGFEPGEMGGHNFTEFIHPDDAGRHVRSLQNYLQMKSHNGFQIISDQFRVRTQDGLYRWYENKTIDTVDERGRRVFIGTIRDITERKRVEDALRESESHYRLLADHVHDVIWTADLDLHITYISPSVKNLRGVTPEEALAESVSDALTPASFGAVTEEHRKVREVLQNGGTLPENHAVELEFRCRDGSTVWTESIVTPTIDRTGAVTGVVGITRNIGWRREAERALRESENKFSTIFRSSLVALTLISIRDRTFYDVNDAFVRSTGYSRDEVIGKTPDDIELFAESETGDLILAALRSQRFVKGMEVKFRIKNREIQTCLYSANLIHMGEDTYVLSNIENITACKNAEEALRQANRKLTLLSSINRHDINNQLGALNGFVELLKRKIPDPLYTDYFSRIATASNQISNLIQFTREYEEIGGQAPLWQDLQALVHDAGKSTSVGHVTLINDLPAKMEVFADPLIAKVFSNLIDNAVRHGGPITTIRFSLVEQNGDRIVVCEDDGTGVIPSEKEQIFDLGFGKNTGFGLALSKEILDITGIRISETGEPGRGARFEMTVPNGAYRLADEKPGPA